VGVLKSQSKRRTREVTGFIRLIPCTLLPKCNLISSCPKQQLFFAELGDDFAETNHYQQGRSIVGKAIVEFHYKIGKINLFIRIKPNRKTFWSPRRFLTRH